MKTERERGSVRTYLQIADTLDLTLDDISHGEIGVIRTEKALLHGDGLSGRTAAEWQIISETVHAPKAAPKRTRER